MAFEQKPKSLAALRSVLDEVTEKQSKLDPSERVRGTWHVDERKNKVIVETDAKNLRAAAESLTAGTDGSIQVTIGSSNPRTRVASAQLNADTKFIKVEKGRSELSTQAFPDRLHDGQPYYTANRIIRVADGRANWCTSAVINFSDTHMYTAGHCFPGGGTVLQGWFDEAENRVYFTGTLGPVVSVQWGNNRIDAESIETNLYDNRQYHGGVTDPIDVQHFVKFDGWIGMLVCGNGSVSGTRCTGEITATNICVNYADEGVIACGLTRARSRDGNALSQDGDSGGPVIRDFIGSGAQVVGIISGGNDQNDLFYTPMRPACEQLIPHNCN